MKQRLRNLLSLGVGLVLLFSASAPGFAGSAHPDWMDAEGFRKLPWGTTTEKAHGVYPDLSFVRYAINGEMEMPSTVYMRKNEDMKIDDIRVDEILYWFRNGSFYKVTVSLIAKVGPRTLETPAGEAFDKLLDTIHRIAGPPIVNRTTPGIWNANRKGVWHTDGLSVSLSCFEPPGVSGEEMILEIMKRTASKGRVPE